MGLYDIFPEVDLDKCDGITVFFDDKFYDLPKKDIIAWIKSRDSHCPMCGRMREVHDESA